MKKNASRQRPSEEGFVLAVIIVFLVVLTLTGFLVASMTRTDVQVVQNIQREKEAFFIAEAGVTEAFLRLRRRDVVGNHITVDEFTFDPDIVPGSPATGWEGRITFTRQYDAVGNLTTTTVQPDDEDRLAYSDFIENLDDHPPVRLWWPDEEAFGRSVLAISATGRSHRARRTVTLHVIPQAASDNGCLDGGVCTLSTDVCPGILLRGSATVQTTGSVVVNSDCDTAIQGQGAQTGITTTGEERGIDVVGGVDVSGTVDPEPNQIDSPGIEDPLGLPSWPTDGCSCVAGTTCNGLPVFTTDQHQGQGVYCNGLRFSGSGTVTVNGDYVITGGVTKPLTVGGATTLHSGPAGVTFHSVRKPGTNLWGSIDLGSAKQIVLAAPPDGDYRGVLINQHPDNENTVTIKATLNSGLDGIIYAPGAPISFQNATSPAKEFNVSLVVASAEFVGANAFLPPTTDRCTGSDCGSNGYDRVAWYDQ